MDVFKYSFLHCCPGNNVWVCAICWSCSKRTKERSLIYLKDEWGNYKLVATSTCIHRILCDIKGKLTFLSKIKMKIQIIKISAGTSRGCTIFVLGAILRLKHQGWVTGQVSLTWINWGATAHAKRAILTNWRAFAQYKLCYMYSVLNKCCSSTGFLLPNSTMSIVSIKATPMFFLLTKKLLDTLLPWSAPLKCLFGHLLFPVFIFDIIILYPVVFSISCSTSCLCLVVPLFCDGLPHPGVFHLCLEPPLCIKSPCSQSSYCHRPSVQLPSVTSCNTSNLRKNWCKESPPTTNIACINFKHRLSENRFVFVVWHWIHGC